MHPDKKVGMALGILLVGIVGAFFFRNDTKATEQEDSRKLASADELDERIRTGTQVPYLPDRDEKPAHSGDVPDINIAELIEEIPEIGSPEVGEAPVVIPEPIRIGEPGPAHDLVGPIPSPDSNLQGVEAAVDGPGIFSPIPKRNGTKPVARKATMQIHEVASGETLSGIASKYLGTHRRFQELFEANRDVLKSPDAIRVGMKLKIPQSASAESGQGVPVPRERGTAPLETPGVKVPEVATPKTPAIAPEPKDTAKPPKPKFIRPKGVVPRISSKPGRSLGQRPPPGVPRVEGLDTVLARRRTPSKAALREKADTAEKKQ